MAKVTLNLAGRPLTFETGTRVEGCLPPHVSIPKPGPCPGGKRAKKGATAIAKAVTGRKKAVADTTAKEKARRSKLAAELTQKLAKGDKVQADADLIAEMFSSGHITENSPPMNLAKLGVNGPGNETLFDKPLRDIPRKEMPALPDTVAKMLPFLLELGRRGIKVELVEDMDPRQIRSVQTELSAPKVAYLANAMKDGWKEGGAMIISRENALGDGHHRWAGAAMARMLHEQGAEGYKPMGVTALKVDLPIDELLKIMNEYSGERKSLEEKPPGT